MKNVVSMKNSKSPSIRSERQLELMEFEKTKREKKEHRNAHRGMKRYEVVDNDYRG